MVVRWCGPLPVFQLYRNVVVSFGEYLGGDVPVPAGSQSRLNVRSEDADGFRRRVLIGSAKHRQDRNLDLFQSSDRIEVDYWDPPLPLPMIPRQASPGVAVPFLFPNLRNRGLEA